MTVKATELPAELREQFGYINAEIAPFIEDEAYHQGIARLDVILDTIPKEDAFRPLLGALYGRRAELLLEVEDDQGAWEYAQKAMNAGWYDAAVYSIGGWAMYNLDDYDLALQQFEKALELDPERVGSLTGRAMVFMELEEWDSARVDLSRVLQVDPEDASAHAMRAEVGVGLGTVEAARRDIERARELDPDDPDFALFHARLSTAQGDFAKARAALDDTLDDEEAALEALLLRASVRMMTDDLEGARKDAIRASNTFGDEAFAFVVLASVQLAQGNVAMALKAADRAVKLDPSLPDAYMVRYAARQRNGDDADAQKDFERASKEPTELFMFLLGPCYDVADLSIFSDGVREALDQRVEDLSPRPDAPTPESDRTGGPSPNPFEGIPGMPGMPLGLNPMKMLDQVFDDQGNVRPAFKPILKMAMRNAPALLRSMPPSVLQQMGGIDPTQLEGVDLSQLDEAELERQMKLFYKVVKAGDNPLDPDAPKRHDDD